MKKFENYLKKADLKEKAMIVFSFFVAVGFGLNMILPELLQEKEDLQSKIETLEMKLSKPTIKRVKREIKTTRSKILIKKEELNKKQEDISYIVSSLYKIDYLSFSDLKWTKILDDILAFSIKRDIEIESLQNSDLQDVADLVVKARKNVKIKGVGRYANVVKFLQYIENLSTLVTFENITMSLESDKKISFEFDFKVYGLGL